MQTQAPLQLKMLDFPTCPRGDSEIDIRRALQHAPGLHTRIVQVGGEPVGQRREAVARYLRVEMVFEMVG
jgi:hypothetical protein